MRFTVLALAACSGVEQVEVCNGVDDDLDGVIDEDAVDAVPVWIDGDGDGYGRGDPQWVCDASGRAIKGGDCDDTHPDVWPGRPELCNGLDDDCDGEVPRKERDVDNDGWPACWDCDDRDDAAYPGADELCNGRDDDCDGEVDEQPAHGVRHYVDQDDDGFGDAASERVDCVVPAGRITQGRDCDDAAPDVHPGVREHCDEVDHDCDGTAWPKLTVPRDVALLDDAVARTPAGQTICVLPGEHTFSAVELNDVWVEGTADGVTLISPITLAPGGGLKRVSVHGEVRLSTDGTSLRDVTLRSASLWGDKGGSPPVISDLRVTEICDGVDLGGLSVSGLRLDHLNTSCTVRVGDVTDLVIDHVTLTPGSGAALLRTRDVTGFVVHDVDMKAVALIAGAALQDGAVRDVLIRYGVLLKPFSLRNVVLERIDGRTANWGNSRIIDVTYGTCDDLVIRDVTWKERRLRGLVRGPSFRNMLVRDVFIDGDRTDGAVAITQLLEHVDVRGVRVNGELRGLFSGTTGAQYAGLVVAGVRAEDAPHGIVVSGVDSVVQGTFTDISGDGPLFGAGLDSADNIDVSWCDVTALSVGGDVSYSNVWMSEGAAWARSSNSMSVDPDYLDRSGSDPDKWDLHLNPVSPLVDAGDPDAAQDDDGTTADVGGYGGPSR